MPLLRLYTLSVVNEYPFAVLLDQFEERCEIRFRDLVGASSGRFYSFDSLHKTSLSIVQISSPSLYTPSRPSIPRQLRAI